MAAFKDHWDYSQEGGIVGSVFFSTLPAILCVNLQMWLCWSQLLDLWVEVLSRVYVSAGKSQPDKILLLTVFLSGHKNLLSMFHTSTLTKQG